MGKGRDKKAIEGARLIGGVLMPFPKTMAIVTPITG